jgi:hypothetical protein
LHAGDEIAHAEGQVEGIVWETSGRGDPQVPGNLRLFPDHTGPWDVLSQRHAASDRGSSTARGGRGRLVLHEGEGRRGARGIGELSHVGPHGQGPDRILRSILDRGIEPAGVVALPASGDQRLPHRRRVRPAVLRLLGHILVERHRLPEPAADARDIEVGRDQGHRRQVQRLVTYRGGAGTRLLRGRCRRWEQHQQKHENRDDDRETMHDEAPSYDRSAVTLRP